MTKPCVQIPAWIFTDQRLTPSQVVLLGVLLSLGGDVQISTQELAKMLAISSKTIFRNMKALEENRFIAIAHQTDPVYGGKEANRYTVQSWVMGGTAND
jgi:Fe2+ or Zn2+ uptake regulation protein